MDQTEISIKEVCRTLRKSRQTVYSHLNKLSIQTHKKGKQAYLFQNEFEHVQQSVKKSSIDSPPYNRPDISSDNSEKPFESNKEKEPVRPDNVAVKALTEQLTVKDKQIAEKDKQIDNLLDIQKADKSMLAGYQKKFGALEPSEILNLSFDERGQTEIQQNFETSAPFGDTPKNKWLKFPQWGWLTMFGLITPLVTYVLLHFGIYQQIKELIINLPNF